MRVHVSLATALLLQGCCCAGLAALAPAEQVEGPPEPLVELRRDFQTRVYNDDVLTDLPEPPPPELLELVSYPAPLGRHAAYISPSGAEPGPAIIWISGGFDWGIGAGAWLPAARENDQSARAFREAGIVLMRPSLRGSSGNPGRNECFFGEVDDILAAADFLAARPDVDPDRLYLGGHSTGGTLVLLVAACTDRFRAVFSFGPMHDPVQYGEASCINESAPFEEQVIRAPIHFVDEIRSPTYLIEGLDMGNTPSLNALYAARGEAPIHRTAVAGLDHFSVLAPATELIAARIMDGGEISVDAQAILQRR